MRSFYLTIHEHYTIMIAEKVLFLQQKGENLEHFLDLKATKIFKDSSEQDCQAMMFCFKTRFKNFKKNEYIVEQGKPIQDVVLMVKGSANVENLDTLGNVSILMQVKKGDVFGLESAFAGDMVYKDSLLASEKCLVLFMDRFRLTRQCENRCKRHDQVIKNLMQAVAETNKELMDKLIHMSQKSTRDKLLSYFSLMSERAKSSYFEIPFNVTELANYLSVDRSAMSSELSKLKKAGIIDYDKKQYRLIKHGKKDDMF